jgi:CheY-like chemotaxis protein/MinD-like ATPase involved in chromosome partitioning or flagellar assembly
MTRILIIDDDESLLQMVSIMLKRAGYTPILATDGYKGIEIAQRDKPDMAIVDVMMPNISGYEVCRILREDSATMEIPLLILTALSQPEQRDFAEDAGADDFVTKPVTRDDLLKHVEELLYTGARNVPAPLEPPTAPEPTKTKPRITPIAVSEPAPEPQPPSPPEPALPTATAPEPAPPPAAAPAPSPAQAAVEEQELLPVVGVMGLARSVGTTTLAVNMGLGLMQFGRSCIVDLNDGDGEAAVQLKMTPPKKTWLNLLDVQPGADKRQIGSSLMLDRSVGVALLAAPTEPAPRQLGNETLGYIFSVLGEGFPRVVVDLPSTPNPMSIQAMRLASYLVFVIGDNPADLWHVPQTLAAIDRLGLQATQYIVINHTRPHGVTYQDVTETINQPVAADFPYEAAQVQALMEGKPLVMSQPDSLFSRTLLHLARQL